eukprot:CAMPEP_0202894788 /NCGR_PEP_ID=MMETSP1392-20130828/4107_1 /ASSEMBLY_ACC=CAM_ASM_000868 /TAXON_ID=225041 /ORGANISM="Chlamydomonas chlamydogama, Strain SAG 11-48b" /LENGTH=156 /DNA_ID=CAMNT_0049579579 /DNA_START=617 /DNA_END=1083 /DNA_ORIENTATION=+
MPSHDHMYTLYCRAVVQSYNQDQHHGVYTIPNLSCPSKVLRFKAHPQWPVSLAMPTLIYTSAIAAAAAAAAAAGLCKYISMTPPSTEQSIMPKGRQLYPSVQDPSSNTLQLQHAGLSHTISHSLGYILSYMSISAAWPLNSPAPRGASAAAALPPA